MSVEENVASRKKQNVRKSYEQLTESIENKKEQNVSSLVHSIRSNPFIYL